MNVATQELPIVTLTQLFDFQYDKPKDDWTLEANVPLGDGEIVLRLDPFLKEGESYVKGDETWKRAKAMGSLAGYFHAKQLLGQQSIIPKEWRSFVLVFPGTLWRAPRGRLHVPCLYWLGRRWCLDFDWPSDAFSSHDRIVRLSPGANPA